MTSPSGSPQPDLRVRLPQQQRSRAAWQRILDAGVALLEEGGYEAFTIAAVCERAGVAPRAVYERVTTKDALFLAVYEHAMVGVRSDHAALSDGERWRGLPAAALARGVVRELAGVFERHAALLRSVILISGAHPEVYRRGGEYSKDVGELFVAVVLSAGPEIDQPDPRAAALAAFNMVFSTLVLRTAYGASFATADPGDDEFLNSLGDMVSRYLFGV